MGGWRLPAARVRSAGSGMRLASRGRLPAFHCRNSGSLVSIPRPPGPNGPLSRSVPIHIGTKPVSPSGRVKLRNASTVGPLLTAPTSGSMSRRLSTGWFASASTTAAGIRERINGSARSSFASTINVLEGLLEYERATGGTPKSQEARRSGEEYLLERRLFRRLGTGEPADERFLRLLHPNRWRYDVLRALDYFRAAGTLTGADPDPRTR